MSRAADPGLPEHPIAGAGERVLVVAPHPDDETLALGGWISQSTRRGADVRIAFLTDGDGFALCGASRYRTWPGTSAMRRLGCQRRREAATAALRLGVPAASLAFLRYPDRGLAPLWLDHWSPKRPFRSPYTAAQASGQALLADLERMLSELRPDRIYYPDSLDDHPDHWAASCFVRTAVERTGGARIERTYLVHRGRWPRPPAHRPEVDLAPPLEARAFGALWERVALDEAARRAKADALRAHSSQLPLVGGFLRSFLRRTELCLWWPEGASLADSVCDRFARSLLAGADFTRLEVDGRRIRAALRGRPLPGARYRLCWKPVSGSPDNLGTRGCNGLEATVDADGPLLIAAFCTVGPLLVDRTPWFRLQTG